MSKEAKKEDSNFDDDAFQMMFNVSSRNQIQQIAIADNKANRIAAMSITLVIIIIGILSLGGILNDDSFLTVEIVIPLSILLGCLLYTSPSPRDATLSRMPSSA